MQQGLFDKPRAIIRETRILECWCPKCHQGQVKTLLNDSFSNDRALLECVGKEFKCENCGLVYEVGDYISVMPNAFMVASRSQGSKVKSNMEVESWLNEPAVKDGGNYDSDAIMKDLELLNKSAEVTNKFLENMLAKINKPSETPEIELPEEVQEEEIPETTSEAQAVLKQCIVQGNVVKLPDGQLDRKLYADVKKALELIGGKWKGGKTYGFVFQKDPTELLEQIANGEKRNLKKEYQFFATPPELAARMAEMAELGETGGQGYGDILEPSAGQGAIVKAIHDATGGAALVFCYELMDINRSILEKTAGVKLIGDDFMKAATVVQYDRIIANPPFTKNQDIDHIRLMYNLLKPGGVIVALSSPSWTFGSQKKQVEFREWTQSVDAYIEEIPVDTFKESGTGIRTVLIKIKKPVAQ
jgi:hypothetical protein